MTTAAPAPALFINEDLSKRENRTNLALLGVLTIPEFRHWFLGRLALPPDCVIYPPVNTAGGRPDLVVVSHDQTVRAWIEIELGGENQAQMAFYRSHLDEPVKSIVGSAEAEGTLTLSELADVLSSSLAALMDAQQRKNAQIFIDLVAQVTTEQAQIDYVVPGAALLTDAFAAAIVPALGAAVAIGAKPAPGKLVFTTITQRGWSIRAYTRKSSLNSVALIWAQSLGSGVLRVPSEETLKRFLPEAPAEAYAAFLREVASVDINSISGMQNLPVPEATMQQNLPGLTARLLAFTGS